VNTYEYKLAAILSSNSLKDLMPIVSLGVTNLKHHYPVSLLAKKNFEFLPSFCLMVTIWKFT